MKNILCLLLIANCYHLAATTWQVGPSRTYTKPSQVSTLVRNGDTVEIDAGVYESDVARWAANSLLLKGVGGMAHLKANGSSYGQKAIWVIAGDTTKIENIEFSECRVPDKNGAGIRQEGKHLWVSHCYFHHNEDGILAGDNVSSNIIIEYTEFAGNGYGDGLSHNLYINHVNSLIFRYNYTHGARVGHELKSRAHNNYILYNRIADGDTGTASRSIDLPNGGLAIIAGNEIEQGPQSQNSNIIGYGLEGLSNPGGHTLYVVHNTIVNNRHNGSFIHVQANTALCKAWNNIMAGPGTFVNGTATLLDTAHNLITTIAGAGLEDAAAFNYQLSGTSLALNGAVDAGMAGVFPLLADEEYVHPLQKTTRLTQRDIGAHEFVRITTLPYTATDNVRAWYANGYLYARLRKQNINATLQLFDMQGRIILSKAVDDNMLPIPVGILPDGTYLLHVQTGRQAISLKIPVF